MYFVLFVALNEELKLYTIRKFCGIEIHMAFVLSVDDDELASARHSYYPCQHIVSHPAAIMKDYPGRPLVIISIKQR